jgi:hypothetical protein
MPQKSVDPDIHFSDEDVAMVTDTEAQPIAEIPPANGRPRRSQPRISYAYQRDEALDSDRELEDKDDDESDTFNLSEDEDEEDDDDESDTSNLSEADNPSEDESSAHSDDAKSPNAILPEDMVIDDSEVEMMIMKPPKKKQKTGELTQTRAGKGIDLSLPPLSNIEECMLDMTHKAIQLGLDEAVYGLDGRLIKVATMCSGTESPLLALQEISEGQSLHYPSCASLIYSTALKKEKQPPIRYQHEFSAEIEGFKQAFIERNFHPPILFRDVREFIPEDNTEATTAYGAKKSIPADIDILIAGFVCKDLSRLNNKGKTLDDHGESGDTWRAVVSNVPVLDACETSTDFVHENFSTRMPNAFAQGSYCWRTSSL